MHIFQTTAFVLGLSAAMACGGSTGGGGGTGTDSGSSDAAANAEASSHVDGATGQPDAPANGGHPFTCGTLMCDSAAEVCSIVNGHLPGQQASYACASTDGGTPSCGGTNSAMMPGQCGCYASPNGEVTTTECPP